MMVTASVSFIIPAGVSSQPAGLWPVVLSVYRLYVHWASAEFGAGRAGLGVDFAGLGVRSGGFQAWFVLRLCYNV